MVGEDMDKSMMFPFVDSQYVPYINFYQWRNDAVAAASIDGGPHW